jgi:Cu(I)/Ag(I) efflux system membrane protein CusA/SilA
MPLPISPVQSVVAGLIGGFIVLAGVAAEFGVIMLLYLKNAWRERLQRGQSSQADLCDAIREGAVLLLSLLVIPAAYRLLRRRDRRPATPPRLSAVEESP